MRTAVALALAISISAPGAAVWAQSAPVPAPAPAAVKCENPNALGVAAQRSRSTPAADPGFGFEHFKAYDFPARPRSDPHVRRWPVAGKHLGGTQGAGRTMHQGRCSSRSASMPAGIRKS